MKRRLEPKRQRRGLTEVHELLCFQKVEPGGISISERKDIGYTNKDCAEGGVRGGYRSKRGSQRGEARDDRGTAEVMLAIEVKGGGGKSVGPTRNRRAEIEAAIEIEGEPDWGCPR